MIGVVTEVLMLEQVWAGGRKGVEEERAAHMLCRKLAVAILISN